MLPGWEPFKFLGVAAAAAAGAAAAGCGANMSPLCSLWSLFTARRHLPSGPRSCTYLPSGNLFLRWKFVTC
eukprot:2228998-Rhodomonas_salina.1